MFLYVHIYIVIPILDSKYNSLNVKDFNIPPELVIDIRNTNVIIYSTTTILS